MKRSLLCLSLFVLVGLSMGCTAAPPAPDTDAMIAAADALDAKFIAALNAGDMETLIACYANDAVSMPPDMMMAMGHEAIMEGFMGMMENMKGAHFETNDVHQMPFGNVVVGYGMFRATMPGPDGNEIEMVGRFTDVKAERNGEWVYLIDHASVPLPASDDM